MGTSTPGLVEQRTAEVVRCWATIQGEWTPELQGENVIHQ